MRSTIRRDRSKSYDAQMNDRELDRSQSRLHPNSILNDVQQRAASAAQRAQLAAAKEASRAARRERRRQKKLVPVL